ncbi:allantoate permease [Didymella exigua CBS 183.55]|uniref:Allantoate permease n=1 Tax=Didymella exigua CBS 183.55 TaxID=1150837 RepID=A0A6A5S4T2_9PLEO|nr:allantoate permease [Didymella exigua CBS 183.55]KAF1932517.1 allantoate permease [Didymella exigua CBS 183.55]
MRTSQELPKDSKAFATAEDMELQRSNVDANHLQKLDSSVVGQVEDLDEGSQFLRQHNYTSEYLSELLQDEALNKRLVRKVDLLLLPLLCGTYFLQYIDKQAASYSAVFDLFETTGITGTQYSWLGSIFYFAYLIAEWPSAYLAQHFPTGRVVSTYCFCWGTVMLCTAATHNFAGFAATRFLLGIFESIVTPAFMMIVSMWYVGQQQPARAGMFYCFNGIGNAAGGILFYCAGYAKGFAVWKIIYIICGGMTVLWATVLFIRLPDNIMTAKSFTVEEKALLIARSAKNRTGVYNRKIKLPQVWEALSDPQIWILFVYTLLNEVINGGIANFGKLIIKDVAGGDSLRTTLYGIPSGFAQVFWVFTGPYLASRLPNARTYIMVLYLCPTIIGTCLIWRLPRSNLAGNLAGYYMIGAYVGSLVIALQLPASNVGGYTKRTTSTAFVFLAYCVGNIIGPQAFIAKEAPKYETGVKTILACAIVQCVLALCLRALLARRNAQRDREEAANPSQDDVVEGEMETIDDTTDFQNRKFRYAL